MEEPFVAKSAPLAVHDVTGHTCVLPEAIGCFSEQLFAVVRDRPLPNAALRGRTTAVTAQPRSTIDE